MARGGVKVITHKSLKSLHAALTELAALEVLVGFPEDTTARQDTTQPTNAALGYIHDNGAPEANIPARPFMLPAMEEVAPKIANMLEAGAKKALGPGASKDTVNQMLTRVGIAAELAIKTKINEGIPPPLSEYTLRKRAAKGREGAMWELAWRDAGAPAGTELAKPLVDTAEMRNSVKHVIRKRKPRY